MMHSMAIGLVLACACVLQSGPLYAQDPDAGPDRLLSPDRAERENGLMELNHLYDTTRRDLATDVLSEAMINHREDDQYMSPLHCAIQAVDVWRAIEAEDMLLTIIDYRLDVASLPVGIRVLGDYFYPAAGALVRLRVDTQKVVNTMVVLLNVDERRLRLLTWVLAERAGSIEDASRILQERGRNENLRLAIEYLESAEHAADLLPAYVKDAGESAPDE